MSHLVLLGDSTLDNAAYVGAGDDVTSLVRAALPAHWTVTLLAIDGSLAADVAKQLAKIPPTATHLLVSVGGNDAILEVGILEEHAGSVAVALGKLARVRDRFARTYTKMLDTVCGVGLPTAFATIYSGDAPDAEFQERADIALTALNDCITREACTRGLPIVDLRVIFDHSEDYANPIEPGAGGGKKLARAIAKLVAEHDFSAGRCALFKA